MRQRQVGVDQRRMMRTTEVQGQWMRNLGLDWDSWLELGKGVGFFASQSRESSFSEYTHRKEKVRKIGRK